MTNTEQRVQELEELCGELYQVLGTIGAPVSVLDKVSAAAAGKPIPNVELLPIAETDFDEIRERQAVIDDIAAARQATCRARRPTVDGSEAPCRSRQWSQGWTATDTYMKRRG